MPSIKNKLLLALYALVIFSCADETEGKWEDNIVLSQKEIRFTHTQNKAKITTESKGWWINHISFNNQITDLSAINTTAENFHIKEPHFSIIRKNGREIHITIEKNTTKAERTLMIALQNGNYFDGISIVQSSY